ncbi:hypothetical protein [Flavobacterium oreochromis]|uniref:Tetratricopeptide repeat protein n=2 Tax=Flavobacterium TaxID=237 RepID=A0A2D0AI71_9FLAO|nr:hypothetical protein [Flavobacterium oreochromis]OWP74799.1 hypothetical protein BWG23_12855 [Flavobacterium oreochromis]OWP79499.1 hypothetical protein BWK62_02065 [Flavobacterium oreochromis]POR28397.1 hypothetical protein BWK58_03540 [Flavobacterium columnare]
MSNLTKDNLHILIHSLSKSEKRHFKLYVNRLGVNTDAKFLLLFNLLDKMSEYDEEEILKSKVVTKLQLSNLKAHLYRQILISLRLNPINQNMRILIREQLDFATILYQKGLYKQSLKILDKAKTMAIENEEKNIAYEIVELEKVIESQYITRSIINRADELAIQAKDLSKQNVIASKLSNLSLQLYSIMLKSGYAKSDEEMKEITEYFNKNIPKYKYEELGFREKLWLYKAFLWKNLLVQDFLSCYKYSNKWIDLFYQNEHQIYINPVWFLKGATYLLECLYLIKHKSSFKDTLGRIEQTIKSDNFPKNDNISSLAFLCIYNNKLNLHFLEGTFKEGLLLIEEVEKLIKVYENTIDDHHIMVFYYKIACLHFGTNNHKKCIEYLNKIIENRNLSMREDLMCFSRILNLVAHYEACMDYQLEIQLKATYKFLIKMNDLHEVQREMIKFLKNLGEIYPHQLKNEFKKLHSKLKIFENHSYEKRAFLYLDIISWLESKIENKPVADIIKSKSKFLTR